MEGPALQVGEGRADEGDLSVLEVGEGGEDEGDLIALQAGEGGAPQGHLHLVEQGQAGAGWKEVQVTQPSSSTPFYHHYHCHEHEHIYRLYPYLSQVEKQEERQCAECERILPYSWNIHLHSL